MALITVWPIRVGQPFQICDFINIHRDDYDSAMRTNNAKFIYNFRY